MSFYLFLTIECGSMGYYDYENSRYIYRYKDHLGNVRVSYVKNNFVLDVKDTNDYYPFGMSFLKPLTQTVYDPMAIPYNYKYSGKELQETGMYDFGARMYMPDLGRWGVADPLAETTTNWSPYNYALDNPVMFIDPDGRKAYEHPVPEYNHMPSEGSFANIRGNDFIGRAGGDSGGGSAAGGLTANTPGSISLLHNYFNVNGVTSSSIDFLYKNYDNKKGIMTWWYNGEAASGNSIQGLAGYQIRLSNNSGTDWYGPGGKTNWFIGAAGTAVGNFADRFYVGTARPDAPVRFLGQNYYGNGRTFIKAAPVAGAIGKLSLGLGVAMDGIGVYNYYYNTGSKNKVHPAKAGLNTTMAAYGLTGAGTIPSLLYFGVDAFYPENQNGHTGWEAYGEDYDDLQRSNAAIVPGFITAPYGSQKF